MKICCKNGWEVYIIRRCGEYSINATPIIPSLEERGLSEEEEIMPWIEENDPDSAINVVQYYIAKKKRLINPITMPFDWLNLADHE